MPRLIPKPEKVFPKPQNCYFKQEKLLFQLKKHATPLDFFPKLEKYSRNRKIVISTEKHATPSTGNLCLKLDLWCSKYSSMQIVIGIAYTIGK